MFAATIKTLIHLLPETAANALIRKLAARVAPIPVAAAEQAALSKASRFRYGPDSGNAAWSWGQGPLVILVHGWGGRGAQMAPLATSIAEAGFRCVAFDIAGHGESQQHSTQWEYFLRDIQLVTAHLGEEPFAYVGHSAGALTMMAARSRGLSASRYVCICAPSYPFPPIQVLRRKLAPRQSLLENYQRHLAKQFSSHWDDLKAGAAFRGAGADLLLFYDETDRFVSHQEGDRIQALCPGAQLVKTNAYSHQKILLADELHQAVISFLSS